MQKLAPVFLCEFVIGFGFLSGLWIHIGINPETEIIRAFASVADAITPETGISWVFWLIPLVTVGMSLWLTYVLGGILGLLAVGLAFIAGFSVDTDFGPPLLVVALIIGLISSAMSNTNS
ncbi:MAG: hypothetical protein P3T54_01340 [Dehalogenimonas sp.]|uniref:Uncharacterized protein n=1 Tax=Candidatus Dehalogenimonas loeffleri TaxID=3127115 RepID=A0ABZ2J615_9CHLR|nr:hypothetical protein [Dehalogenimonas sp.]